MVPDLVTDVSALKAEPLEILVVGSGEIDRLPTAAELALCIRSDRESSFPTPTGLALIAAIPGHTPPATALHAMRLVRQMQKVRTVTT